MISFESRKWKLFFAPAFQEQILDPSEGRGQRREGSCLHFHVPRDEWVWPLSARVRGCFIQLQSSLEGLSPCVMQNNCRDVFFFFSQTSCHLDLDVESEQTADEKGPCNFQFGRVCGSDRVQASRTMGQGDQGGLGGLGIMRGAKGRVKCRRWKETRPRSLVPSSQLGSAFSFHGLRRTR